MTIRSAFSQVRMWVPGKTERIFFDNNNKKINKMEK